MTSRKRDRWDSSSEEEDDYQAPSHPFQNKKDNNNTPISSGNKLQSKSQASKELNLDNTDNTKVVDNDTTTPSDQRVVTAPNLDGLRRHNPLLSGCRLVYDSYERLARLDEGTYGVVWKARDMATNEVVALKQIKFDPILMKEGFQIAALREIGVLLALSHECIVTVKEMVVGDSFDKVYMAMEYMEMDLQEATKKSGTAPFQQSELKNMLYQILSAMHHIHEKWILHRDIKTSNILVQKSGKIALCDFGLARKYQIPLKAMTQLVVTLWYRPPELLFGENVYGPEVDMWSVGCVFGELMKKEAIMQGRGELDQVDLIFKLLGVPNESNWPSFKSLPNSRTFRWKNKQAPQLSKKFPINSFSGGQTYLDPNGFDLLSRLLTLDPKNRITAKDALDHKYFREGVEKQMPNFLFFD